LAAYLIADVTVNDPAGYEEYRTLVGPSLDKYGGRFLVRGGKVEAVEGKWSPSRVVMCEFANLARAREWYDSPEYSRAKEVALKYATRNVIFVKGV